MNAAFGETWNSSVLHDCSTHTQLAHSYSFDRTPAFSLFFFSSSLLRSIYFQRQIIRGLVLTVNPN